LNSYASNPTTKNSKATHEKEDKEAPEYIQDKALKERPVFLYFHGNAGNRAAPKRIETYRNLSDRLNVNVLTIDYRGFGNSEGSPTEEGLATDARATWDWLIENGGESCSLMEMTGEGIFDMMIYYYYYYYFLSFGVCVCWELTLITSRLPFNYYYFFFTFPILSKR
jgi:pimeloyl-ACP methyl ester carboxylesterase